MDLANTMQSLGEAYINNSAGFGLNKTFVQFPRIGWNRTSIAIPVTTAISRKRTSVPAQMYQNLQTKEFRLDTDGSSNKSSSKHYLQSSKVDEAFKDRIKSQPPNESNHKHSQQNIN